MAQPAVPPVFTSIYQNNKDNCSGFMRALATQLKLGSIPSMNADGIIDAIKASEEWVYVGKGSADGPAAAKYAGQGYVVLALLKASEHYPAKWDKEKKVWVPYHYKSGHIAIVLSDTDSDGYPYVISGSDDTSSPDPPGRSDGHKTVGHPVWRGVDAPNVYYYRTSETIPQLKPAATTGK